MLLKEAVKAELERKKQNLISLQYEMSQISNNIKRTEILIQILEDEIKKYA